MLEPISPRIDLETSSENYGRFVIGPLEAGFGTTLGNALRRVLLSSLPGAAVTSVRIEGGQHEFSTIPHVKEDTTEFLLNVKRLRLRPLSYRPGRLTLEVTGEGRVCAGDIQPSAEFEIVNPELHLATLDSADARLNVELYVELGKGYLAAGEGDGQSIGLLPLDAVFTPVPKVNYTVERTRIGQRTNYDRLILEVWTDGTITPVEAVNQSARILVEHFSLFFEVGKPVPEGVEVKQLVPPLTPEQFNTPLEQLGLSSRTYNCLRRANINTVGELLQKTRKELLAIKNFGERSLDDLWGRLESLGFVAPETEAAPLDTRGEEEKMEESEPSEDPGEKR